MPNKQEQCIVLPHVIGCQPVHVCAMVRSQDHYTETHVNDKAVPPLMKAVPQTGYLD